MGTKAIQNAPDRALVTYWNEQYMEDEAYLSNRKAGWLADDGDDSNPYVHKTASKRVLPDSQQNSPYPYKHALAQIWTINYNEEFKKKFKDNEKNPLLGIKTTNPDEAKFQPKAVENFERALVRLFGEPALAAGLLYCASDTKNIQRVYVGTQAQFKDFFAVEGVKETFGITKVHDISNPIPVAHRSAGDADILMVIDVTTENKKGQKGRQSWTFAPQGQHVLYKRQGYTSFFCLKSKAHFDQDCEVFGLVNC